MFKFLRNHKKEGNHMKEYKLNANEEKEISKTLQEVLFPKKLRF